MGVRLLFSATSILCFYTINTKWKLVNTYLAYPPDKTTDIAILYLSDIYGIPLINNRLYAWAMADFLY